ncbi:hypothetical protein ACH41H_48280 [Streptomyces sp. NPDC020800]|uniref:hypothetical protein n=1 Tax=Streptomyces sp. NPDC020800 TaxID=3365092 RepID=UPI0037AE8B80
MRFARLSTEVAVVAALLNPTSANAAPSDPVAASPGATVPLPVRDALADLPVFTNEVISQRRRAERPCNRQHLPDRRATPHWGR